MKNIEELMDRMIPKLLVTRSYKATFSKPLLASEKKKLGVSDGQKHLQPYPEGLKRKLLILLTL